MKNMVFKITLQNDTIKKYSPKGRIKRILLVEDDEEVNFITKRMLERIGYDVISTTTAKTALNIYNSSFDLVLTDIKMPVMNGIELIAELRKLNPKVKCLAISGYLDITAPKGVLMLHKPFSIALLLQYVCKALDSSEEILNEM